MKAIIASLLLAISVGAQAQNDTVRLGQIRISFYAVVGAVVQHVLERAGHQVSVIEGLHPDIFPLLGRGEVDLLVAAWLPDGHAEYWQKYGECCVELAPLYEGAHFFWAVPDYVAESVSSVEDLLKPDTVARFDKLIKGTGPGSGLMIRSRKMMTDYELAQAGYRLEPSPGGEWIDRVEQAIAEKQWFVTPLWEPHYLNKAYRLRKLSEPKGVLGGHNRAVLVAHKEFVAQLPPAALAALRRIRIGLHDVTEMDYRVHSGKLDARAVAQDWIDEHRAEIDAWLTRP